MKGDGEEVKEFSDAMDEGTSNETPPFDEDKESVDSSVVKAGNSRRDLYRTHYGIFYRDLLWELYRGNSYRSVDPSLFTQLIVRLIASTVWDVIGVSLPAQCGLSLGLATRTPPI